MKTYQYDSDLGMSHYRKANAADLERHELAVRHARDICRTVNEVGGCVINFEYHPDPVWFSFSLTCLADNFAALLRLATVLHERYGLDVARIDRPRELIASVPKFDGERDARLLRVSIAVKSGDVMNGVWPKAEAESQKP